MWKECMKAKGMRVNVGKIKEIWEMTMWSVLKRGCRKFNKVHTVPVLALYDA